MMKSWKTTAAGVAAIIAAAVAAFQQYLAGGIAAVNWEVLVTAVVVAIGLIFAKDGNVSNAPNPTAAKAVNPLPPPA